MTLNELDVGDECIAEAPGGATHAPLTLVCREFFDTDATQGRDLFTSPKLAERVNGRFHQRDGIIGSEGLRQNVVDSTSFAYGANGLSGDNTGTGTGGDQRDFGGSKLAPHLMRDTAFDQRNVDHVTGRLFGCLLDARRDLVRFAVAPTDTTLAVADDHHGGEAEPSTTFDNGGTTFDLYDAIEKAVIFGLLCRLVAATTILIICVTNGSNPQWAARV